MLEKFFEERGLSKNTKKHYYASVRLYQTITGKTLQELLEEAEQEEKEKLRWKERKLRQYLIDFRKYLYENKGEGTALTYMSDIKAIYRQYEIEVHDLPVFNSKQINKIYVKRYEDIPTKQELIDAYYECNSEAQDILLFASSTGISKVDFLKLTIDDFIEACRKYFELNGQTFPKQDTLTEQLYALKDVENIIPLFEGHRQKTGSRYTTFASPEFVEHKLQHLIGRDATIKTVYENADDEEKEDLPDQLYGSDKLFDISESHLSYVFRKINDKLHLGKVGSSRKFRCHQLRAYQATTLLNVNSDEKFTESEIDTLQGRVNDKTHRAYLVESASKLYCKYRACVDELMLFKRINIITDEEVEEIRKENSFYKKEIIENEKKLEVQQQTIDKIIANQKELELMLKME